MSNLPVPAGLTERQSKFVDLFIDLGGKHQERAAVMAGIASSGAAAWASRALRHPAILAEVKRRAVTTLTAETVASVKTIVAIRDNLLADDAVRLRAASQILDRGGVLAATLQRLEVDVTVTETREDIIRELADHFRSTGHDPRAYIGGAEAFLTPLGKRQPVKVIDQHPDPVDAEPADALADEVEWTNGA